MDVTPLTVFYGSMLGLAVAALFVVMFRQGRSPTHNDMHNLARQTRDELRKEIRDAAASVTNDTRNQINALRQDINRVLTALANHEHVDGRVMITVQPDTEPVPTADD